MRKLLGTVQVFLDDSPTSEASVCSATYANGLQWPKDYEITIFSNSTCDAGFPALPEQAKFQSLLCHELGHVVAQLTHTRDQHPLVQSVEGQLPAEETAWKLASQIAPVDSNYRNACLETYRLGDNESAPERSFIANVLVPRQVPKMPKHLQALFSQYSALSITSPEEESWENEGGLYV